MLLDLQLGKVLRCANQLKNVVIATVSSKHYAREKDMCAI